MQNDRECYEWLSGAGVPVQAILTKADKLSPSAASLQKSRLCQALSLAPAQAIMYSSVKNTGREELIESIVKGL
jgi:GTP-binding protein